MCLPHIESATALTDYDEESPEFSIFVGLQKGSSSAGPINVSVDLKYDVLCLYTAYPLESGEVTAGILY